MITFVPPLGATTVVAAPSLPSTRATPLSFHAINAPTGHNAPTVQLWSNIPHPFVPQYSWHALDFPSHPAAVLHLSLPLSSNRFDYTYRLLHSSGDIEWLGTEAVDGHILRSETARELLLIDGWTVDSTGHASLFTVESNVQDFEVARICSPQNWAAWALGEHGFLDPTASIGTPASLVFILPLRSNTALPYILSVQTPTFITVQPSGAITVQAPPLSTLYFSTCDTTTMPVIAARIERYISTTLTFGIRICSTAVLLTRPTATVLIPLTLGTSLCTIPTSAFKSSIKERMATGPGPVALYIPSTRNVRLVNPYDTHEHDIDVAVVPGGTALRLARVHAVGHIGWGIAVFGPTLELEGVHVQQVSAREVAGCKPFTSNPALTPTAVSAPELPLQKYPTPTPANGLEVLFPTAMRALETLLTLAVLLTVMSVHFLLDYVQERAKCYNVNEKERQLIINKRDDKGGGEQRGKQDVSEITKKEDKWGWRRDELGEGNEQGINGDVVRVQVGAPGMYLTVVRAPRGAATSTVIDSLRVNGQSAVSCEVADGDSGAAEREEDTHDVYVFEFMCERDACLLFSPPSL